MKVAIAALPLAGGWAILTWERVGGFAVRIQDIDAEWGSCVYAWVRPSVDYDWRDLTYSDCDRSARDFRPAMITGFVDDKERYGTASDPRRVTLIGNPNGFPFHWFDIACAVAAPESGRDDEPQPATPSLRAG